MVEINLLAELPTCESCGSENIQSYHLSELCGEPGSETVVDWRLDQDPGPVSLTNGTYLCPSCGEFSLRFREGGMLWD